MKKLMSIMLALALTIGVAGVSLAQDAPKDAKTTAKKGKGKKGKDTSKTGDTAKKGGGKKKGDTKADSK